MKNRKSFALFLALALLLGILSGCGGTPDASSKADSAQISETAPAETDAPTQAPEEPSSEEPTVMATSPELPLVDVPTTLSLWWGGWDGTDIQRESPNDVMVSQEAEKRTGISIDYKYCSRDASEEQTALMYAGGDYCDIITGGMSGYTGGFEKAVEDNVYIYLNDLLDENAPNYAALRNEDPAVYKDSMTDDGNVVVIWEVSKTIQWPWQGLLCRADLMEAAGMEMPTTYDDMHELLLAFQDEFGMTSALSIANEGYNDNGNLTAGYDVTGGWYQKDGKAKYGAVEDDFRDYLEMISTWYSEGLISPDFVTKSIFDNSDILNGQTGIFVGNYTDCTNYATLFADPDARLIGIPEPVPEEGHTVHLGQYNTRASKKYVAISTACEDPGLALRWIDYFYSEEGALLNSYGIEGETFEFDENGKPVLSEFITNSPEGYTFNQAMYRYLDGGPSVRLYDWERELSAVNEDSLACEDVWSHDGAYVYPQQATMTAEEAEALTGIMSDIETYANTMILQFIRGEVSLDEWDSYTAYIRDSGLQEAIDIKQASLDRYNAR